MPNHLQDYDLTHINTAPPTQAAQPITEIAGLFLDREGYQLHFPPILRLCKVEFTQSGLHKPAHSRSNNISLNAALHYNCNMDKEQYNVDIHTNHKFPEENTISTRSEQKPYSCTRLTKNQPYDKYLQKDTILEIKEQLKIAHQ